MRYRLNLSGGKMDFFKAVNIIGELMFAKTSAVTDFFLRTGARYWLGPYLKKEITRAVNPFGRKSPLPRHIILAVVDHYEPFNGNVDFNRAAARVAAWVDKYPAMAGRHRDSDGRSPQHTWFYPPHLDHCFLKDLTGLCKAGYGEIEMHLHHNHMEPFPDTPETLKRKILQCVEDYSKFGIFCLPDGSRKFAFIHGDWSLDNSRGPAICGVNNEIGILKECGCYADFTFPSLGEAQPAMINTVYYAKGDPAEPKAYNKGRALKTGGRPWGDLLMIPGIIGLRWKSRTHRFRPSIEASNLDESDCPSPARIDFLVKNALKITGNPAWLFVKLHTHGAREGTWDCLLETKADQMYSYLERRYNDGKKYVLHYATAREMFNIIKAAEAGKSGNPDDYRDFEIPRYLYLKK